MKIKLGSITQVGQRMENVIREIYGALYRVNIHNHPMKETELTKQPIHEHWKSAFIVATLE